MKLFLLIVIYCLTLDTVQAQKAAPFNLSGKLIGRDTGYIVLWHVDTSDKWIRDTTYLQNGKFKFKGFINEPSFTHLISSAKGGNFSNFYLEAGKQSIMFTEGDFSNPKMDGSYTQKQYDTLNIKTKALYKQWDQISDSFYKTRRNYDNEKDSSLKIIEKVKVEALQHHLGVLKDQIRSVQVTFIQQHPDSYVSPVELANFIKTLSLDSAELFFNAFTARIKNSRAGLECAAEIEKKKQIQTGTVLQNFEANNINGQSVSLAQFKGRYVLLDFWASWCVPCREAIPRLKEIYNQYHLKGFEVLAISIDKNRKDWEDAVQAEAIGNWYNVLRNETIQKIFETVRFIPAQFLINSAGQIIWNSLDDNTGSWEDIIKEQLSDKD